MEKNIAAQIQRVGASVFITPPSRDLPLCIQPKENFDIFKLASLYQNDISDILLERGAILFRGFKIGGAEMYNRFFSDLCGDPMTYKNRSSPREKVYNNIYTSTSHPADQRIYMHTENSYGPVYNRIIAFYCAIPPISGGETPIADERRLLTCLGEGILSKFKTLKIQYVRNIYDDVGLNWQTIYQTDDKKEVTRMLNEQGIEHSWVSDRQLRTKWVMPAFQKHPVTGEELWFNHMYFGNKLLYNPIVLEFFKEEDLPFSTYYGDGSPIEATVLDKISAYYAEHSIVFKWQKDDMLLLDNMMFAHGRNAFSGERSILTAMGQPFSREQH